MYVYRHVCEYIYIIAIILIKLKQTSENWTVLDNFPFLFFFFFLWPSGLHARKSRWRDKGYPPLTEIILFDFNIHTVFLSLDVLLPSQDNCKG